MDSSLMEIAMYPSSFKDSLRQWLETFPDKITFGTDCFPYNEILGAEESYWLGNISARQALAAAVSGDGLLRRNRRRQSHRDGACLSARHCHQPVSFIEPLT